MIVGHLPAGYLVFAPTTSRLGETPGERRRLLTAALVASVAPDVDVVYFYATGRYVHHHAFVTHWPLFWLVLTCAGLAVAALARRPEWTRLSLVVGLAAGLHLVLDTIAGSIRWLAPFSDRSTTLVEIPATHGFWVLSFMAHWTFGVELALVVAALGLWMWRSRRAVRIP